MVKRIVDLKCFGDRTSSVDEFGAKMSVDINQVDNEVICSHDGDSGIHLKGQNLSMALFNIVFDVFELFKIARMLR